MAITLDFLTQDRSAAVVLRSWQSRALTELLVLGCGHLRRSPSLSFCSPLKAAPSHLHSAGHVAKKAVFCSLCERGSAWPGLRLRISPRTSRSTFSLPVVTAASLYLKNILPSRAPICLHNPVGICTSSIVIIMVLSVGELQQFPK